MDVIFRDVAKESSAEKRRKHKLYAIGKWREATESFEYDFKEMPFGYLNNYLEEVGEFGEDTANIRLADLTLDIMLSTELAVLFQEDAIRVGGRQRAEERMMALGNQNIDLREGVMALFLMQTSPSSSEITETYISAVVIRAVPGIEGGIVTDEARVDPSDIMDFLYDRSVRGNIRWLMAVDGRGTEIRRVIPANVIRRNRAAEAAEDLVVTDRRTDLMRQLLQRHPPPVNPQYYEAKYAPAASLFSTL